jgi:hypothetical protein
VLFMSSVCSSALPAAPGVILFCSERFLLTYDWPCYHHSLSGSASSCAPSTHLSIQFLCLFAIPLILSTCLQVSQSQHRFAVSWISLQSRPVSYNVCTLPPPQSLAHGCSTPSSVYSATTMGSLDCSQASVSSVLLDSPSATPRLLSPSHRFCRSLQVPCEFGALDPVSNGEAPVLCLHVPYRKQPSAAASLAGSDDEGPILHIPPRSVTKPWEDHSHQMTSPNPTLLWLRAIVMMSFLFRALCFPVQSPLPIPSLPSPYAAGLWWWPMPSWVRLTSICFFFSRERTTFITTLQMQATRTCPTPSAFVPHS